MIRPGSGAGIAARKFMKTVGILVGGLLLAACASATDSADVSSADVTATSRVQMNDVSIVLPLAKNAAELDGGYLHASSAGLGGSMLPKDVYTKNTALVR